MSRARAMASRAREATLPPEERARPAPNNNALKILAVLAGAGVLIWAFSESRPAPLELGERPPDPPTPPTRAPVIPLAVSTHHSSPVVAATPIEIDDDQSDH